MSTRPVDLNPGGRVIVPRVPSGRAEMSKQEAKGG